MSKRIANTRMSGARNGRVRYGWRKRRRRQTLLEQIDRSIAARKNVPTPTRFDRMKNKVNRYFRRGVR